MKKIIALLLSLTMILSLTACTDKNESAKAAVDKALVAIVQFDVITLSKYIDIDKLQEQQVLTDLDLDIADISKEELNKAKLILKNFDYEILDSNEQVDSALVKVKLTNQVMRKLFLQYIQYAFEIVLSESDDEIIDQKLDDKFVELLDADDAELVSSVIELSLNKVDGQWKIDINESVLDAILGGLVSIAKSFDQQ